MDLGRPGSETRVLSDANGLPLLVGLSAANTHDSLALTPMVEGHQTRRDPHGGRYFKPRRLPADKTYDSLTYGNGSGASTSASTSPAEASNPANDWADVGGSSSAPCPGDLGYAEVA
ncbi:hypothetical protein GCM10020227_53730 [Streptomyces flavovirens]